MVATLSAARLRQAFLLRMSRDDPLTLKLITRMASFETSSTIRRIVSGGSSSSRFMGGASGYYTSAMIGEKTLEERLRSALEGRLEGYLRTDEASRALWSTDASIYLRRPVGVVVARSEGDVRLALSAARELGLSITPRGTGTSLAGQATAPGLALDVSEMRRALEIDLEGRRCVVEPGLVQGELNAMVEPHGLVFGADTSTSEVATLGGMVGNNSAGMGSLVFGVTSDQILGVRRVLASG